LVYADPHNGQQGYGLNSEGVKARLLTAAALSYGLLQLANLLLFGLCDAGAEGILPYHDPDDSASPWRPPGKTVAKHRAGWPPGHILYLACGIVSPGLSGQPEPALIYLTVRFHVNGRSYRCQEPFPGPSTSIGMLSSTQVEYLSANIRLSHLPDSNPLTVEGDTSRACATLAWFRPALLCASLSENLSTRSTSVPECMSVW
jgi:hypothetical protein